MSEVPILFFRFEPMLTVQWINNQQWQSKTQLYSCVFDCHCWLL